MNRDARIAINLLVPPVAAWLLGLGVATWLDEPWLKGDGPAIAFLAVCLVGGIPTIIHTIIVEYVYRRGLQPSCLRSVGLSTVSGLLAGFLVLSILVVGWPVEIPDVWAYMLFPAIGVATGAITGTVLLLIAGRHTNSA